jgi:hypothetical protein
MISAIDTNSGTTKLARARFRIERSVRETNERVRIGKEIANTKVIGVCQVRPTPEE